MRFSLELPTSRVDGATEFVTGDAVAAVTRAAATAGFSAVFVTDHPAPDTRWLDHGGHHALDPFVALSFAAAADPDVLLHTNIYVAAYRNPFLGAKLVQSLDVLSGGRLVLGVAAGYLKPEFAALGVDFDDRGALLDEALAVLDAVLGGDDVAWEGRGFRARGVRLRPVPRAGRPPVWVGGNSKAAMRRAAHYDGWAPFETAGVASATRTAAIDTIDDLRTAIPVVRSMAAEHRGNLPFDVCWSGRFISDPDSSVDERCNRVVDLEAAGVTWTTVSIAGATRAEVLDGVDAFGRDVIANVGTPP
jgi:probable F420-dependent oxidoreductase